jgi:phosphoribosylformylglycinamidine synthase
VQLRHCSEGGLAVALAEMATASGIGIVAEALAGTGELFSEGPSRVLFATARPDELIDLAFAAGIPARVLGRVGGERLVVPRLIDLEVTALAEAASGAIGRAVAR